MTKKINISLSDKTEEELKETIFETKGMKKGNISEAAEEAFKMWIKEQKRLKKEAKELDQQRKP